MEEQEEEDMIDFAWKNDLQGFYEDKNIYNESNNPPYLSLRLKKILGIRSFDMRNNVKVTKYMKQTNQ